MGDVVCENGIPQIVPTDLFNKVQEKLEKNKKAPARHKAKDDYLLTTPSCSAANAALIWPEKAAQDATKLYDLVLLSEKCGLNICYIKKFFVSGRTMRYNAKEIGAIIVEGKCRK